VEGAEDAAQVAGQLLGGEVAPAASRAARTKNHSLDPPTGVHLSSSPSMPDSESQLLEALDKIHGTGKFSSCGEVPFFFPEIAVHGEELAFPLSPSQIRYLISKADAAPYGKGEATVLDESVRSCWQIDASHLSFPGKGRWLKYLRSILEEVSETMGVSGKILAKPYKLLIYEKGGHFLPHRDTEKIEAMFGSLIVALPSAHRGGQLFIRHDGEEVEVDFSKRQKEPRFQHAAFFADCEHEVTRVEAGYRVCLVYNLAQKGAKKENLNQNVSVHTAALRPVMKRFRADSDGSLQAILLNHQYTEANFSLNALKNEDYTKAIALMAAAEEAGFVAHLGLVTLHQMGELEGDHGYGSHRGRYDEDESSGGSMGEIYEQSLSIAAWRKPDGGTANLGTYAIETYNLVPETKLDTGDPDEQEEEGFTGNAGCTMDYWYHRAAVVLWPKERAAEILCRYNLHSASELFLAATKRAKKSTKSTEELGAALIAQLQIKSGNGRVFGLPIESLLLGISQIASEQMLTKCFDTLPVEVFSRLETSTWSQIIASFDPGLFESYFAKISAELIREMPGTIVAPLDALLSKKPAHSLTRAVAEKLRFVELPQGRERYYGGRDGKIEKMIHTFFGASHLIETKSTKEHFREQIVQDGSLNHLRTDLSKALLIKTHRRHLSRSGSLFSSICEQAIKQLTAETERDLAPYPDWSRPMDEPTGHYRAKFLNEVYTFMLSPDLECFEIKAKAEIRSKISNHISLEKLDLDQETTKSSIPHTLHLTKNAASYARAVKQRQSDIALLEKLTAL